MILTGPPQSSSGGLFKYGGDTGALEGCKLTEHEIVQMLTTRLADAHPQAGKTGGLQGVLYTFESIVAAARSSSAKSQGAKWRGDVI